ncbi:MAG: DUF6788 family protein, partial [Chloroflexota bacterium]
RPHVETLLGSDVLVEGSFVTLGRKCGKPTCRCATGAKHFSKFLSRSEGGKTRLAYVPAGDVMEVARKTERYKKLRQARAELMKLSAHTAELSDALGRALAQSYPPPKRDTSKRRKVRPDKGSGGRDR